MNGHVSRRAFLRRAGLGVGAAALRGPAAASGLLGGAALRDAAGRSSRGSSVRTFILVIDGMIPDLVGPTLTPNLVALQAGAFGGATSYVNAQVSMVTETNANHVGVVTGMPAQHHGIVANNLLDRSSGSPRTTAASQLVMAPTLFDAAHGRPELETAAVLGKQRLRDLFDCTRTADGDCGPSSDNPEGVAVEHVRPDILIGGSTNPGAVLTDPDGNAPGEPFYGATLDNFVMDQVIRLHRESDPDITFVNLPSIDVVQHTFGPRSPEGLAAVANVDAQVGRLVEALQASGAWQDSLLFVTADHSFSELDGAGDAVGAAGVQVGNPAVGQVTGSRVILSEHFTHPGIAGMVTHNGSASIYLHDPTDAALAAELVAQAGELRDSLGRPAVDEAFSRIPAGDAPPIPPEWGLDTPRIGEVLLAADDQHVFHVRRSDIVALLTGHHGGPTALPVTLIVASGGSDVATAEVARPVTTRDIAPTVAWLHGLEGPDGAAFPGETEWSGRLREAFVRRPMPRTQAAGETVTT